MKKYFSVLLVALILGAFCAGITVCADDTQAAGTMEIEMLGLTLPETGLGADLKGKLIIYPMTSTSINNDPELYGAYLYYFPATKEELEDEKDEAALALKMTVPGFFFAIRGDREQLIETVNTLWEGEIDEKDLEENLVQVGDADGYQFFLFCLLEDEYAASLDEEFAAEYRSLPAILEKELQKAQYYAPVDPMKSLTGQILSFTTTDLDGNEVTSEDLFKDNEITMVNIWGVWCVNCVNEMEELAEINTRLKEKGCGIVGLEWEEDPSEATYQEARDLMEEKGTNYPSVLMPEDNEILNTVGSFPTTFFVDREGTILTKPIVGARVKEYEPTMEALIQGISIPETDSVAARTYTYRVFVTDEENQPLEEVTVQFCDDLSCTYGETDEEGCATFEVSGEKVYDVHILEAPEEYTYDEDEVFHTAEISSDLTIVLNKAA